MYSDAFQISQFKEGTVNEKAPHSKDTSSGKSTVRDTQEKIGKKEIRGDEKRNSPEQDASRPTDARGRPDSQEAGD